VDRTSESLGKVKYTFLKKPDGETNGHIQELQKEMEFRGLTTKEFEELLAKKKWTACTLAWLVKHEIERVSNLPEATEEDIAQAKKWFLPLSGATFEVLPSKPAKSKAPPKKRKALKPLDTNQPKKKVARRNKS
jgi:ABC-type phosphate transport system substrate-binding protein